MEDSSILPDTASFFEQLAEIMQYREEQEQRRRQQPAQPNLAEIMAAIQQLMVEVVQLLTQSS